MNKKFKVKESFEAKEFDLINIMLGFALLFFTFCSLLIFGVDFISIFFSLCFFIGAVTSFKKVRSKKVVFKIDTTGIFYFEKLITNWNNYKSSYYNREMAGSEGLNEDTFLNIQYYKDGISGFFIKKIKLDNIDKDENDIIDAIEFYYNASLNKTIDQSLAATTIKE